MNISLVASGQSISPNLFDGLKWRMIGPFRGGRVVAVTGVPGINTTFYFGAVDGGIWKTMDAGVVWTPVFDGQPVASIGALAVAPSDPNTIYAGTGESDIRSDLSSGNGVYKSVDGGQTWRHMGLDDTRQIGRIVIDPRDAGTVYVGALGHAYGPNAERGVYKSSDGGEHWNKVLDQGPEIGVADLTICSSNPKLLFATMWHTHRPPWSVYGPIDGRGSGIFRSQDAGKTWNRIEDKNLPEGDWGRVGIDVAANGQRVYALIQAEKGGLFRSDDGGNSWRLENSDSRLTSRAWYFSGITIDPGNADVIYMPNIALYRSEDGGKTISIVRGAPGGDDYHQLWVDPKNPLSMVLGTDQGTSISLDRGKTWSSWYNQPTAQIYHVTTDNQFPYVVYGAQQDSGAAAVLSRTDHGQITPRDWFPAGPSESGYMVIDADDPNIIYLSGIYGSVDRYNRHTGLSQNVSPWPTQNFAVDVNERKYRAPWGPVLVSSSAEPHVLYLGTQFVLKTTDGGLHWETISDDLTGAVKSAPAQGLATVDNAKQRGYGVVSTIAPSAVNPEVLWAGSDTGLIHVTKDGGKNWQDVTPKGMSDWSKVELIESSHFDAAAAYAAVSRARLDDQTPYLYRTRDYGATWQLITAGISAGAFLRAVREDPQTRGLLYAGTELGVYVSFDDGDRWESLQMNLPVTSVRDLTVHGDDLVIATHGRSFWILDDMVLLRQVQEARKADGPWLYRSANVIRIDNDSFAGTPIPPEEPTAQNPPSGAMIDYFLNAPAKEVTIEIFDGQKNLVRRFSSADQNVEKHRPLPIAERWFPKPQIVQTDTGMHRFVWNLVWGGAGPEIADEDDESGKPTPPKVPPGTYEVRLTVDGQQNSQMLKVEMDPRSSATQDILEQQFELARQIFGEAMEAHRTLNQIESMRKKLADVQPKAASRKALEGEIKNAQSNLDKILSGKTNGNDSATGLQDAYPSLTSALRVVEGGDRPTPSQAILLYREAGQQIAACSQEWKTFEEKELPELNRQLKKANLGGVDTGEK